MLKNKKTAKKIKINIKNKFDLSKKYPEYKKFNLQENLDTFYKKYGDEFYIIYNNKKLLVQMIKIILFNNKYFYRIKYKEGKNNLYDYNFKIDFRDNINNNPNCSYIANIEKSKLFSGSELVKISLEINRILGAEKTYLVDETYIPCNSDNKNMSLKLIKLLEKDKTFYMNLGFEFDIQYTSKYNYSNKKELEEVYNKLVSKIRKIKCETLINELLTIITFVNSIITDNKNYYKNIDKITIIEVINEDEKEIVEYYHKNLIVFQDTKLESLLLTLKENIKLLHILRRNKNKYIYLYKFLIHLFKEDCYYYNIFINNFLYNYRTDIKFGNTIYSLESRKLFDTFYNMINPIYFSYTFK